MQFSNTSGVLPQGYPGFIPEGVQFATIRAMANADGGDPLTIDLKVDVPKGEGPFIVTFSGGCCTPDVVCEIEMPDPLPTEHEVWIEQLAALLNGCPRSAGFGQWVVKESILQFTAYDPRATFNAAIDVPNGNVDFGFNVTQPTGAGHHFVPGQVVFVDPTRTYPLLNQFADFHSPFDVAIPPSQDLTDEKATEMFAGIVLDCRDHENAPVLDIGSGIASNCLPPECQPKTRCVRVIEKGPVRIGLETPFDFSAGVKPVLHYRFEANTEHSPGSLSLSPGAGLAVFPAPYTIIRQLSNGLVDIRL